MSRRPPVEESAGPWSRLYFYSDGRTETCHHGPPVQGRYRLKGSAICTTARGRSSCIRIVHTEGDRLGLVPADVKNPTPTPITVMTGAEQRNCLSKEP